MKYWLISDDAIDAIKANLIAAIRNHERVALSRPAFRGEFPIYDALHELNSGLHKTEEVPEDML